MLPPGGGGGMADGPKKMKKPGRMRRMSVNAMAALGLAEAACDEPEPEPEQAPARSDMQNLASLISASYAAPGAVDEAAAAAAVPKKKMGRLRRLSVNIMEKAATLASESEAAGVLATHEPVAAGGTVGGAPVAIDIGGPDDEAASAAPAKKESFVRRMRRLSVNAMARTVGAVAGKVAGKEAIEVEAAEAAAQAAAEQAEVAAKKKRQSDETQRTLEANLRKVKREKMDAAVAVRREEQRMVQKQTEQQSQNQLDKVSADEAEFKRRLENKRREQQEKENYQRATGLAGKREAERRQAAAQFAKLLAAQGGGAGGGWSAWDVLAPGAAVVDHAAAVATVKQTAHRLAPIRLSGGGRHGRAAVVVVAVGGGPRTGKSWLASQVCCTSHCLQN